MKIPKPFKKKKDEKKQEGKEDSKPGKLASKKPKQETKQEEKQPEETEVQEVELTQEQTPTVIKDTQGTTLFTLKTTTEKLLYQQIEQLNIIIQQNQQMLQLSEKE